MIDYTSRARPPVAPDPWSGAGGRARFGGI